MKEEAKHELQVCLSLLKGTCTKNNVSMGVDKENGRLLFFSTEEYLRSKKFDGFSVNIENLVR